MSSATDRNAYVYESLRLPRGKVRRTGGTLAPLPPYELLAQILREFAGRGLDAGHVDDVLVGVSTVSGEHVGVGRLAIAAAGWPDTVPSGVVSRQCCSGLDALSTAAAQIGSGAADVIVAGGVESMSRVPMMSDQPGFVSDTESGDLAGFVTIGVSADATAIEHGITRSELDEYAARSHERALAAPTRPRMLSVTSPDGGVLLSQDEGARSTTVDDLAGLDPLFSEDPGWARVESRLGLTRPEQGLHTVASAPQMCDSASAAVIGSAAAAARLGPPKARIAGYAHTAGRSPRLDSVVGACQAALRRAGIAAADIDVAEINESFAVTPLLTGRELGLPLDRVNPHGGAIAVGHPLGASGGILLANALDELDRAGGRYALLAIPAALGLSTAVVVERLD